MKTVQLIHPHTHAGVPFNAGAALTVPDGTARWLIAHGIAQAAPITRSKKPRPSTSSQEFNHD